VRPAGRPLRPGRRPARRDKERKLRADGRLRIQVGGTAGKMWGAGELGDFADLRDDIVGIAEYIVTCEEADVVQVF
jgi:peroxiredoxin family protein